jgi:ribosomal protein L7Ae-like RNA K-turn-binding protein
MKQSTNAVKAGRASLVLLPPDVEDSASIDAMVDTLLLEAQRAAVPVLYCLSRRRLGKAVGSSMRQSAVAVCGGALGAEDKLAKVLEWVGENTVMKEK